MPECNVSQKPKTTKLNVISHLQSGCVVEVCGADALPDLIPVGSDAPQRHLLLLRDLLQLHPHLAHLPHRFRVDEVLLRPVVRVSVSLLMKFSDIFNK